MTFSEIIDFVVQTVFGELIIVIIGVLFANYLQEWWQKRRYGHWQVIVKHKDETIITRPVSARKAKEILEENADLAVFLKGIISPKAFVNCDLITEGKDLGVFCKDADQRIFQLNVISPHITLRSDTSNQTQL